MADARFVDIKDRKANLSPLMVARSKASLGEKLNFCPFDCPEEELDENGYCRHLVGFTNDGDVMEPMVEVRGTGPDPAVRRVVQGAKKEPVRKTDKLVRITVSSRVYRDVDQKQAKAV